MLIVLRVVSQAVPITVVMQIQETNMLSHDCNKCDRGMRLASQSNKTVGRIVHGTLAEVELLDRIIVKQFPGVP